MPKPSSTRLWTAAAVRLATDLRPKNDLLERSQGAAAALASVSGVVTLSPDGDRILVDKLQDKATQADDTGVTFIPSVFNSPHLVVVHAPGWHPVVQYPVAEPNPAEPVSLETVTLRLEALAHPVRCGCCARWPARPAHHRRAGPRLGTVPPGGVPPSRRAAPRGPAHRAAARPATSGTPSNRPAS
ncbi:DUF5937 family protein [Streptomyces sp. KL116D]|uniref:DUF5937 family protein n=1 Tax=Streptomyces sp. KL116D TaxID=3045152 RepID=UPI0035580F7C